MSSRYLLGTILIYLSSCTLPEEKEIPIARPVTNSVQLHTNDSNAANQDDTSPLPIPPVRVIKRPYGIYQGVLHVNGKMQQTIAFYPDYTFQLQETYPVKKEDSVVRTSGNWSPSDGYIWLYKDQVVRGRYKWKGDTLQYVTPAMRKSFSLNHMSDAMDNETWKAKKKEGMELFGTGTEPFWSVAYQQDSISFQLADWTQPLHIKLSKTLRTSDSVAYYADNDSTHLSVTVFPYFCNDGMSDFVYSNRVRILYNNQVYKGCGMLFK